MAESPWLSKVRRTLGARPDICMWRSHAGTYAALDPNVKFLKDAPKIKVNPDGIGDLMGVQLRRVDVPNVTVTETVNPNSMQPMERPYDHWYGQAIAIETKAAKGKQRQTQLDFERAFRSCGGVYIVSHENQWDVLWHGLGREPDPAAEGRWQEIWDAISREQGR